LIGIDRRVLGKLIKISITFTKCLWRRENRTQDLCGLNNFKTEGKLLQTEHPDVQ
jgi:hypothetical protein